MPVARSPEISAVICTFNRDTYLCKALDSLVHQTLSRELFEVLVVDNGISEATRRVVEGYSHKFDVRYMPEPKLGIAHARNAGWRGVRSPLLAYLDDDCVACPQWLELILFSFHSVEPAPACVGGSVTPLWETPRPPWLSDRLLKYLSMVTYEGEAKWLEQPVLVTANLAFTKDILAYVGGFDIDLGHKGQHLLCGEDTLALARVIATGKGCYYDARINVGHHVLPTRLTRRWFVKRAFLGGISKSIVDARIEPVPTQKRLWASLRSAAWACSLRHNTRLFSSPNGPESVTDLCARAYALGRAYGSLIR